MTNYARISRNDDETFSDEAEFVAKRRDELVKEWLKDRKRVAAAIDSAMEDGFPGLEKFLAEFFCALGDPTGRDVSSDAYFLQGTLLGAIGPRLERDAETAAQAEYDSRLTGPEGDL